MPWIFVVIFILIQGIFLLAYNPGLMYQDSFDQLKEARNFFFTDWHPLFSTLYVYVFDKLFHSPIGISVANISIFVVFLGLLVNTFKNNTKLLPVILLFYCVMPVYYLFNISLWKDVPYSYFFSISILFLYRLIIGHNKKDFLALLICILLVTLFRHNGITVSIASIIAIFLLPKLTAKDKLSGVVVLLTSIVLIRVAMIALLPGATTPIAINKSNFFVVLMSHMASLPHNGNKKLINELKVLSPVIAPDKLAASYHPGYITTLLFTPSIGLDHNKVIANRTLIVKTFIKLFIRHPNLMIKSMLIHGSLVWSPTTLKGFGYYVVEPGGNVCTQDSRAYSLYKCDRYKAQNINYINFVPGLSKNMDLFINKYADIFFMRPVMYMLIIFFSVLLVDLRQKSKWRGIMIVILPLAAQIITMFFLAQAQDFRYHYGLVTIAPVFVLMMYGLSKKQRPTTHR